MEKNKGFTLVELLVVIAIIGILAVLIVPSIMKVNNDINQRMLDQKIEYIISAAELYGSNNPDLFNGADEVSVPVWKLIEANYIEADKKMSGEGACSNKNTSITDNTYISNGCIVNPTDANEILNLDKVLLIKKPAGIVGEYKGSGLATNSTNQTLVRKVCDGFQQDDADKDYEYYGYSKNDNNKKCKCNATADGLVDYTTGEHVTQCILVSSKESGAINNWLKYGSSSANWRVIGLYEIDGKVSAKMITSTVVDN